MKNSRMKKRSGFTLIEMITVIAILGILMVISVPNYRGYQKMVQYRMLDISAKQITIASMSLTAVNDDNNVTPEEIRYTSEQIQRFTELNNQINLVDNGNYAVNLDDLKGLLKDPVDFVSGYITEEITVNNVKYRPGTYVVLVYTCADKEYKYRTYVGGVYAGDIK